MPGVLDRNSIPLLDCEFPRAGTGIKSGMRVCHFSFRPSLFFLPFSCHSFKPSTVMSYFYGNLNDEINLGDGWGWMQDVHTEEDRMAAFLGVVSHLVDGADVLG